MLEIITKSIKDMFDKQILFTSLIPIIISAIFWGFIFFIFHGPVNSFLTWTIQHIPFIGDAQWLKDIVASVGGIFVYYELLIITSVMIVGIVADKIVDTVNNKYYHNEKRGFGTVAESIFIALKQNVIFLILFILLLPAMFVPVLNIFVHIFLWSILIKNPTFYDSIAIYATKDEFKKLKKSNKLKTWTITIISASLFLIPIFGVFVYILQLLMFAHYNLKRLQDLR